MLIDLKLLTARRRLMGARYTHEDEDEDVQDASWTLVQILKMSKILLLLLLLLLIQNDLQCVSVKSPSL